MAATRSATATWHGNLFEGSGSVSSNSSEQLNELPVSWAARTEDPEGKTSPEELLAAAHSACFSMAFSNNLAQAGYTAERLSVTAEVTFEKLEAGWTVVRSHLIVHGDVPGIDQQQFGEIAEKARDGCPISRALKGNVELSVDAILES